MFIFAHIGITLGAATLVSGVITKYLGLGNPTSNKIAYGSASPGARKSFSETIGLKALSEFLDVRLLIIGSIFPDIIDKPLEFAGFGNGRSITHTLLIALIFLLTGSFLSLNYKKTWLLAVAIGIGSHLILDFMWQTPYTLFWPVYGWSFPGFFHRTGWDQIGLWWATLTTNFTVDITEGIGAAILIGTALIFMRGKKLKTFLLTGKI
jgi:inner membrane protein